MPEMRGPFPGGAKIYRDLGNNVIRTAFALGEVMWGSQVHYQTRRQELVSLSESKGPHLLPCEGVYYTFHVDYIPMFVVP